MGVVPFDNNTIYEVTFVDPADYTCFRLLVLQRNDEAEVIASMGHTILKAKRTLHRCMYGVTMKFDVSPVNSDDLMLYVTYDYKTPTFETIMKKGMPPWE